MRWVLGCAALLAACIAAGPGASAAPLEAYGRLPSLSHVQISPDGGSLAFVVTKGDAQQIVLERLADHSVVAVLEWGNLKIRALDWADSQNLVITNSVTGQIPGIDSPIEEWFAANDYDVAARRLRPLMKGAGNLVSATTTVPTVRTVAGRTLVFLQGFAFVDSQGVTALYQNDLAADQTKRVHTGDRQTREIVVDANGRVAALTSYDEATGKWTLRVNTPANGWKVTRTIDAPVDSPGIEGLGRDGQSVLVSQFENDATVLHEVSIADGTWGAAIKDTYRAHIFDPLTHAWAGGETLNGDDLHYDFFEPRAAQLWAATTKAFGGQRVSFESWSSDKKRWVIRVDSPTEGAAYALVDLNTKRADWIGNEYADLKAEDIGPVTPVRYKAADGLEITGYLTLPHGKAAKNLPLVVLPHGGPEARDEPGFDWWAQAVASRGYAVLQPNFRGSAGFGADFVAAGYGQWGRKMQTDLSDGVRHLAAQGVIDPKRVCIFGGSYGGYAALAGAAIDTGVYRCAVSLAGPSDLRKMLHTVQQDQGASQTETLRYWDRFMGAKAIDDPALDAISPAQLAAKVTIPVLLIHGKDDTVVPYAQSEAMAEALQRAGKPVSFVTLKGEDHWLSRSETRLQMLTAAMAFIEANNPPN